MSALDLSGRASAFPNPRVSFRRLALGMLAMNVAIGILTTVGMCFLPLLVLIGAGFQDSSVFKDYIGLAAFLIIGGSFGMNAIVIGIWFFRALFSSGAGRVIVLVLLLMWYLLLLVVFRVAAYFDIGLVVVVLCYLVWDGVARKREGG